MSGFELLSDQGLRLDGRKAGELRRIRCRMAVFGQVGEIVTISIIPITLVIIAMGSSPAIFFCLVLEIFHRGVSAPTIRLEELCFDLNVMGILVKKGVRTHFP